MSAITQGLGNGQLATQGLGNNTGFTPLNFKFVTLNKDDVSFENYVERDLNTQQTDSGVILASEFIWEKQVGGLVLGILNQGI